MSGSNTVRSLKYLRDHGYIAGVVERRNPKLKFKTHDLFGCFDIVAAHPNEPGTLYVQTTSWSHRIERLAKVLERPETRILLLSHNRIVVHGWKKRQKNRRVRWVVDSVPITLQTLTDPNTVTYPIPDPA